MHLTGEWVKACGPHAPGMKRYSTLHGTGILQGRGGASRSLCSG